MSRFPDPLLCEHDHDDVWKLHEAYRFIHTKKDGTDETITVPSGFMTDFASVPAIFWTIVPKSGQYDGAAVIHDYLYQLQGCDVVPRRSRHECDDIFLDGMDALGVPAWKRKIMWLAVRMFGWLPWNGSDDSKISLPANFRPA